MSSYQIYSLLTKGITSSAGVSATNQILKEFHGNIEEDCLLILEDTAIEEMEPAYVKDGDTALQRLQEWPTLGSIEYSMPEILILVSFKHLPTSNFVSCVKLSLPTKSFESLDEKNKRHYSQIAAMLHEALGSARTIMDWGLELGGFSWIEEIERLKKRVFEGEYSLDLRK